MHQYMYYLNHSVRYNNYLLSYYNSDVIGAIDQSEFAGFEYVNPLLMSKVEEV